MSRFTLALLYVGTLDVQQAERFAALTSRAFWFPQTSRPFADEPPSPHTTPEQAERAIAEAERVMQLVDSGSGVARRKLRNRGLLRMEE